MHHVRQLVRQDAPYLLDECQPPEGKICDEETYAFCGDCRHPWIGRLGRHL